MSKTFNPVGAPVYEDTTTRGDSEQSEFERFRELTEQLVQTPKPEIDEQSDHVQKG